MTIRNHIGQRAAPWSLIPGITVAMVVVIVVACATPAQNRHVANGRRLAAEPLPMVESDGDDGVGDDLANKLDANPTNINANGAASRMPSRSRVAGRHVVSADERGVVAARQREAERAQKQQMEARQRRERREAQERDGCAAIFQNLGKPYGELRRALTPGFYLPPQSDVVLFTKYSNPAEACGAAANRQQFVQAAHNAVTAHSGRIGLILPLSGSGTRSALAAHMVTGMRAAFQEAGLDFDRMVIVKDSGGVTAMATTRLAELVFEGRVAMVVGGFLPAEAADLAKWSAALQLPVLLLNHERELTAAGGYAFSLYPDEQRLAETLAAAALRRGYKRVAILRPVSGKSDRLSNFFRAALTAKGGQIAHDVVYTPGNFESMQSASRKLLQADNSLRSDEYRQAYLKARQAAAEEGVHFDPRQVVLKPVVDFDAVLLPDDFRTVRHFAKLFRYHMVDHLPLLGNHEWRSPALVEPYDDFLDGSVFADFIGSYEQLPPKVGVATLGSPYFIPPQDVLQVDFRLIGYRAGQVCRQVARAPLAKRRDVLGALNGAAGDGVQFPKGHIFDQSRRGNWPTYVFTVKHHKIQEATSR